MMLRPGGSAANTAAWLAHLGCAVTFAGCVGEDPVGAMLIEELSSHGAQTAIRTVAGAESGAVAVEIGEDGERLMRSARGANEALSPDDLRRAARPDLTAVHLSGYALLGSHGLDLLEAGAEIARATGAHLTFDPSSCGVIERIGATTMLSALRHWGVNLFLPNLAEAAALTGARSAGEAAATLAGVFPAVIVKNASRGAAWSDGNFVGGVPTKPVTPLDTTGAGDAFNAGALHALATGKRLADACGEANDVAGRAILLYGGRPPSS
jgi:sugar/nucleoside kinase (ribokinase family)